MELNNTNKILAAPNLLETNLNPPPISGRQKSTREEKTSGTSLNLTTLYSKKISSPYSLLNQQFKDIQLQLHSSSVSNPYTFSIQGNKGFSGSCAVSLPSSDTLLVDGNYQYGDCTIIIPAGVRVLKCYAETFSDSDEYGAEASIKNRSNDIEWIFLYQGGYGSDHDTSYVGVTPGKTYYLRIEQIIENTGDALIKIYYSSAINNHSINIADY